MTNISRWAWQSPEEVARGKVPADKWWSAPARQDPVPSFAPEYLRKGWRIVMRLTNGQLVIVRAK